MPMRPEAKIATLAGPPRARPGGGEGEVHEVVAHLRRLKEGREDDEENDVGRAHRRGRAEDARIGVDLAEEALPAHRGRIEEARQVLAGEDIGEEDAAMITRARPADAPRQLHDERGARHRGDRDADGREGRAGGVAHQGAVDRHQVDRDRDRADPQHDVRRGKRRPAAPVRPADQDAAEGGHQQRHAEIPDLAEAQRLVDAVPHQPVADEGREPDARAQREERGRHEQDGEATVAAASRASPRRGNSPRR